MKILGLRDIPRGDMLAFDFGLRRIGVAQGHTDFEITTPIRTIKIDLRLGDSIVDFSFDAIEDLIKSWCPAFLICGYPLRMGGEKNQMSDICLEFASYLCSRFGLMIVLIDERLSSVAANQQLNDLHYRGGLKLDRGKKKDLIDQFAAQELISTFRSQSEFRVITRIPFSNLQV